MKKVAALLVLALAALTLVACGGGDDDTESAATTTETSAESTGGGGAEGGGGSVVDIEAAEGSDLAYVQKEATAKAGQVSIEFTNPQSLSHDVAVEDANGKPVGKTDLVADGSATTTLSNLKPGEYTFFCSVPGHREAGMEGTLTVE
jgi:plastocyanin